MGIGFHLDDVEETLFINEYNLEKPQEPKFYTNENSITLPYYGDAVKTKLPVGTSGKRYIVTKDCIQEEFDYLDENKEVMWTSTNIILPKEAFIAAYNAYIKERE